MTPAFRASLRPNGQIGILATTVNLAVATAALVISQIVYAGRMRDELSWLPIFYAGMAVSIVLGVIGFWVSTAGLDVLAMWLERRYYLPEFSVLGVLAVGLFYGVMRGRSSAPNPVGWASATWRLIALIVPTYLVSLVSAVSARGGPMSRGTFAATLVVAVLAVVLGLHLVTRRLHPERSRA